MVSANYKQALAGILQENLSALRAKAVLAQEELSNIISILRQSCYAMENGKTVIPWKMYMLGLFLFHEIKFTRTMVDGLNVFPADLFEKFNR